MGFWGVRSKPLLHMKRIDSHQHFWNYDPQRDKWITDEMVDLQRDYTPEDLRRELRTHAVQQTVAVQAAQTIEETYFLRELADLYPFIAGVVGWVDLCAPDIVSQLVKLKDFPKLKGFRHILEGEADLYFPLNDNFLNGLNALTRQGYTYDLLIRDHQLDVAVEMVSRVPELPVVVDHAAKPRIADKEFSEWARGIQSLAEMPNVFCKISGLVTEADWANSKPSDFEPYLEHVLASFGSQRLMFGSDWPVCNLAGGYAKVYAIAESMIAELSPDGQADIWYRTAERFYSINDV